jgi:peptidoglycan/LPS O-acetylase OafA/YrhL
LEIYLVHVLLFEIVKNSITNGDIINSNLLWVKCWLIIVIATITLKYITKIVVLLFEKIKKYCLLILKKRET